MIRRLYKKIFFISFAAAIVTLLFGMLSSICMADDIDPSLVASKLQKAYDKTLTFKASFNQSSSLSGMRHRERKGSGTVVIKKPGLMRWDYVTPSQQVLVNDGEKFYMYFAAEKQMIVTSARDYLQEDLTYDFFTGGGDILRDFDVKRAPGLFEKKNLYCIHLIPRKQHAQVESLYVWVDQKSFFIAQLQMHDHLGTVTDLILSDLEVNNPVPDDLFKFEPPEGTEVIIQ